MMSMLLSTQSVVGIIIDVVVVLVFVILLIMGFKKGFLQSILGVFSTFLVVVCSVFLAQPTASMCQNMFGMIGFFGRQVAKLVAGMSNGIFNIAFTASDTVETIKATIDGSEVFGPFKTFIKKLITPETVVEGNSVASLAGNALGAIVSAIVCGIVIFLLLKIVLAVLRNIFSKVTTGSRTIGAVDRVCGGVFGVARAGIYVMFYSAILIVLTLIPTVNNFVKPIIQEHTIVTKYVYNFTDTLVDKYVIQNIDDWIQNAWENR